MQVKYFGRDPVTGATRLSRKALLVASQERELFSTADHFSALISRIILFDYLIVTVHISLYSAYLILFCQFIIPLGLSQTRNAHWILRLFVTILSLSHGSHKIRYCLYWLLREETNETYPLIYIAEQIQWSQAAVRTLNRAARRPQPQQQESPTARRSQPPKHNSNIAPRSWSRERGSQWSSLNVTPSDLIALIQSNLKIASSIECNCQNRIWKCIL